MSIKFKILEKMFELITECKPKTRQNNHPSQRLLDEKKDLNDHCQHNKMKRQRVEEMKPNLTFRMSLNNKFTNSDQLKDPVKKEFIETIVNEWLEYI